jgi:hypothetical protein
MSGDKDLDKKVKELDKVYEEMVDSYELHEVAWQYRAWVTSFRRTRKDAPYRALPEEKIVKLEQAIGDFEAIYAAEKTEAEKMPLSRAEAERLREVFNEIFHNSYAPPPEARTEH